MGIFDKSDRFYRQDPEAFPLDEMPPKIDASIAAPMAPPIAPIAKDPDFKFDPAALKAEQDAASSDKRLLALMGGLGDTFGNSQSFGNFFTGKMNPQSNTASRTAGALSDSIQDPIQRQAKLYEAYRQSKEAKQLQDQEALTAREKDPNSKESKALKALAPRWGIQVTPEMSAFEIKQMIDPKKMMETEAASKVDFEKRKTLQEMSDRAHLQRTLAEIAARGEESRATKATANAKEQKERETIYGVARTPDDAKKLKEGGELKAKLDAEINELIKLRESKGAESWDRDAVGRAKQLSKSLLLTKKNMEALGVLSQSDKDIVNEIIPDDPLQFNFAQLIGQDPTMTKLKAFRDDTNRDFQDRLKNRIEGYQSVAQENLNESDREALKWAMSNHGDARAKAIIDRINQKTAVGKR